MREIAPIAHASVLFLLATTATFWYLLTNLTEPVQRTSSKQNAGAVRLPSRFLPRLRRQLQADGSWMSTTSTTPENSVCIERCPSGAGKCDKASNNFVVEPCRVFEFQGRDEYHCKLGKPGELLEGAEGINLRVPENQGPFLLGPNQDVSAWIWEYSGVMYWSPPSPGTCYEWAEASVPAENHVCIEKCPAGAGTCDRALRASSHEPCQRFLYDGQEEYHCKLGEPGDVIKHTANRSFTVPHEAGMYHFGSLADIAAWVWPKGEYMYWSIPAPAACQLWGTTTTTTTMTTTSSTTTPPANSVCMEKCPAGTGTCDRASPGSVHEPCQVFEYKGQKEYHCKLGEPGDVVKGTEQRKLRVPNVVGFYQIGSFADITTWIWQKGAYMYWSAPAPTGCQLWGTTATTSTITTTLTTTSPPFGSICVDKCPAGAGTCTTASENSVDEPCQVFVQDGRDSYHCRLGKPGELVEGAEHLGLLVPSAVGEHLLGSFGDVVAWVWQYNGLMFWSPPAPGPCHVWVTTTTTTTTTRTSTSPPFGSICYDRCSIGAGSCTRASDQTLDEPCEMFEGEDGSFTYHCKLGLPGEPIQGAENMRVLVPTFEGRHFLGSFGDVAAWVWQYEGQMYWSPLAPGPCHVWVTTTMTTTTTRTTTTPPFGSVCYDRCSVGAGSCTRASDDTLDEPCNIFQGKDGSFTYHCKLGLPGEPIQGAEHLGLLVPAVEGIHFLGIFGDVAAWVWQHEGQMYWSPPAPGPCHVWVTTTTTTTTIRTSTSPPFGSICYERCPVGAGICTRASGDATDEPCRVFKERDGIYVYHCRLGTPGDLVQGAAPLRLLVPAVEGEHLLGSYGDVTAWVWEYEGDMYWSPPAPGACHVWVTTTTSTTTPRTTTTPPPNSTCRDMCPVGAGNCVRKHGCFFQEPCMMFPFKGTQTYSCKLGRPGDAIAGAEDSNLLVPNRTGLHMLGEFGDVAAFVWEYEHDMYWSLLAPGSCQVWDPPALPTSSRGSSDFFILAWADEFDYTGQPDPTIWSFEVGDLMINRELQYYTDHAENAWVSNGTLKIRALKQDFGGRNYTSARLVTQGKRNVLYGHVEVRARMPVGKGTWPAIWMHPSDDLYGAWPQSGEIDIVECVGNEPSQVTASVHTAHQNWHVGNAVVGRTCVQYLEDWHVYSMDWTRSSIKLFVDGNLLLEYKADGTRRWETWPFNRHFFLLINIAVGGVWGGDVDPDDFRGEGQVMEVDYVRVYS